MTMDVRSFIPCPVCGKEMRLMAGSFYYEYELGSVTLECEDCHLVISEYAHRHGMERGEANSYGKLVNILKRRIEK